VTPNANNLAQAQRALQFRYQDVPDDSILVVNTCNADDSDFRTRTYQVSEIARIAEDFAGAEHHVWTRISPVHPDANLTNGSRGTEADTYGTALLHVDLDPDGSEDWRERILDELRRFEPRPSGIEDSGRGFYAFWRIPWTTDWQRVKRVNKWLAVQLGGDHCWDTARVLRLPGTFNPRAQRYAEILEHRLGQYELDAFGEADLTPQEKRVGEYTVQPEPLPLDLEARIQVTSQKLWDRIDSEATARAAGAVLRGDRKGVDRSRNDQTIAITLLRMGLTEGQVYSILTHPTWFSGAKFRDTHNESYVKVTLDRARVVAGGQELTNPVLIGQQILEEEHLLYYLNEWWRYDPSRGVYTIGETWMGQYIQELSGLKWKASLQPEVQAWLLPHCAITIKDIPRQSHLVNVSNGMLDLSTGTIEAHSPGWKSMNQISARWDPTADCAEIDAFVSSVLPEAAIPTWWMFCGYCATKGHRVLRYKRDSRLIERVQVGDELVGYNEATGKLEPTTVTWTNQRVAPSTVRIRFSSGRTVQVTPEHPFFVEQQGGWVRAEQLEIGMEVHELHHTTGSAPSGRCDACNEWVPGLQRDHIVPLNEGGPNELFNIAWLCADCHREKTRGDCRRVALRQNTPEFIEEQRARTTAWWSSAGDDARQEQSDRMRATSRQYWDTITDEEMARRRQSGRDAANRYWSERRATNGDRIVSIEPGDEEVTVYNMECQPHNNYFLNGVLVHNCLHVDVPLPYRVMLALVGPRRTGKSTLLNALVQFLGQENVSTTALSDLTGSGNQFTTSALVGMMLNVDHDAPYDKPIRDIHLLKKLAAGDAITIEQKGKQRTSAELPVKLAFAMNGYPIADGADEGFMDRWRVVKVREDHRFTDDNPERRVLAHIRLMGQEQNRSAWLLRSVEGLQALHAAGGFEQTKELVDAKEEMRLHSDTIFAFWYTMTDLVPVEVNSPRTNWTPFRTFFQHYQSWANENGQLPVSLRRFSDHSRELIQEGVLPGVYVQYRAERWEVSGRQPRNRIMMGGQDVSAPAANYRG